MSATGDGLGRGARRAFTLIEVVLAIGILVLVLGITIPMFASRHDEHTLRQATDRIELWARESRAAAVARGRPSFVEFSAGQMRLQLASDQKAPPAVDTGDEDAPGVETYRLPKGVVLRWKTWGAEGWSKEDAWLWRFQPSGLCEPVTLRVESAAGWIEMEFNPLTAELETERFLLP